MRKLIALITLALLLTSCNSNLSGGESNSGYFVETENFGIRQKPILNREYLLYLIWIYDVYAESYPQKFNRTLPQAATKIIHSAPLHLENMLVDSKELMRHYILNPKYLDYPVIGLTTNQVLELQKWMQDRYNENQLIETGILNFSPNQKDEDCFTTEAYLVEQYQGNVRNNKFIQWKDKLFVSNFRLPYQREIDHIKDTKGYSEELKKYSFSKKDFLWRWSEHYLEISKKNLKIKVYPELNIPAGNPVDFVHQTCEQQMLFAQQFEFENAQYMQTDFSKTYPFDEKNKFGRMNFVIAGSGPSNQAVISKLIQLDYGNTVESKINRIAFSKQVPSEFLPKVKNE